MTEKAEAVRFLWPEGMGEFPEDVVTVIEPERLEGARMRIGEFWKLFPGGEVQEVDLKAEIAAQLVYQGG